MSSPGREKFDSNCIGDLQSFIQFHDLNQFPRPEALWSGVGGWVVEGLSLFIGGFYRSFSKCDSWAGSSGIIWELVRNSNSWALPQLHWVRNSGSGLAICILMSLSDGCFWCMLKFETHCSKSSFPREICNHLPEWLWIGEQKTDLWVLSHVSMSLRDPKPHCDPLVRMRVYGVEVTEASWSRSISQWVCKTYPVVISLVCVSFSVVSNSAPWNSPGKNTRVGSHSLPPGESSWPRDWTQVSHTAGRFFIIWAIWEALRMYSGDKYT